MKKLIFAICVLANSVFAHPHFFIDSVLTIEDKKVKNEWLFDKLNSRLLLFDFDVNRNKKFDENEKQAFLDAHFSKLKENNYNFFIVNNDEELIVEPKNVDVNFINRRVSLSFEIEQRLKDPFTLCTIDEKIYMAFALKQLNTNLKLETQKSEYDYCVGANEG